MDNPLTKNPLWTAAILVLATGVVLAIDAGRTILDCTKRVKDYDDHLAQVRELERVASRDEAAVRAFEALETPHPPALADLLKDVFPGEKYETAEQPAQSAPGGWMVRHMDVTLVNVPLAGLGSFLAKAESQRPPWRLTSCRIRATSPAGGMAQLTLNLEALDKAGP